MRILGEEFKLEPSHVYQPIHCDPSSPGRDCATRLDMILEADRVFNQNRIKDSYIFDIGCDMGWFPFELEARGIGEEWSGVDVNTEKIRACQHIAKQKKSKALFADTWWHVGKADVFLILSASHYFNPGEFSKLASLAKVHTIYVEQATHMEYPEWAVKLHPGFSSIPAFYWRKRLEMQAGVEWVCRLVGATRTHLDTIRYLYQLKKKRTIKITTPILGEFCEEWNIPYLNRIEEKDKGRRYFRTTDGKCFSKVKVGKSFSCPWIEGTLLVDAFRWGLLPFMDMARIRQQLREIYQDGGNDVRPHNIMVDESSQLYKIDREDDILTPEDERTRQEFQFFFNLI